jgi:hypothetical protein
VFAAVEDLFEDGPILIALDEFQFLARRNPEIGSLVKRPDRTPPRRPAPAPDPRGQRRVLL